MQGLTHPRSSGIKTGYWSPNKKDELIERLAEYEDTGVTPQEIYSMKSGTILKAIGNQWIPVDERIPENRKILNKLRQLLGRQRKEEEYLEGERTYKPRVK